MTDRPRIATVLPGGTIIDAEGRMWAPGVWVKIPITGRTRTKTTAIHQSPSLMDAWNFFLAWLMGRKIEADVDLDCVVTIEAMFWSDGFNTNIDLGPKP